MNMQQRAYTWVDRHARQFATLGFFGGLGFLGASIAAVAEWLDTYSYVACVSGSVLLIAFVLVVGHLGDPELSRENLRR